jgi:Putative Actinobacterial Holin-X, holin superfamily III
VSVQPGEGGRYSGGGGDDLRDENIGELLKRLSQETTTLVRQELDLAKAEMTVKAKEGGKGAGLLGGGAVAALLFLGALTATLIGLLDLGMTFWVAALIVTVLWGAVAAVLALQGRDKLKAAAPPVPEQAQQSVKEDVQWAKTQSRSGGR